MNLLYKKLFPPETKYDSALKPIPDEYLFDDFFNYIHPINTKLFPYPDVNFINSKLIPHFTESVKILQKNINSLNKEIENEKKIAKDSMIQSQEYLSTNYQINFLNKDIVRKLKVLVPKMEEINRTVIFTQISYLEQRLATLKNIEKVANFLLTSPRYYYINLKFIQHNENFSKIAPEIHFEYNSIKQQVDCLKTSLSLINKPFSHNQENVDLSIHIISQAITLKKTDTKCVQNSEEIDLLRYFLESSNSPIQFSYYDSSAKDIDIQIAMMTNCLLNFCLIDIKDKQVFDIVYYILVQFFFEIFIKKIDRNPLKIESSSQKVNNNLSALKDITLKELGLSSQNDEMENLTVRELFERNEKLNSLSIELMTCHFLINPIEIFYGIRKIGSDLKSIFGNEEDFYAAWKALLIASDVPSVNLIFKKLSAWKDLRLISELYDDVCKTPNRVIEDLIKLK